MLCTDGFVGVKPPPSLLGGCAEAEGCSQPTLVGARLAKQV